MRGHRLGNHRPQHTTTVWRNLDHIFNPDPAEITVGRQLVECDKVRPPAFLTPLIHERRYKIDPGLHRYDEIGFETPPQP